MTARRHIPGPIRYGEGDDRVLRLALLQEGGNRCYWCGVPLAHQFTQIDHIIPRTTPRLRLAELIRKHRLPAGFHLDSPANLGPICAPCNNRKRNNDYLDAPVVHEKLVAATRRAGAVARRYHSYFTNVEVSRALIEVAIADLSHPTARGEFLEHAPAIMQTLALLDEDRADFVVDRSLGLPFGESGRISLALDARGPQVWWSPGVRWWPGCRLRYRGACRVVVSFSWSGTTSGCCGRCFWGWRLPGWC